MTQPRRVLLIANNVPPVRGGSAAVYDSLARMAPDRITVLAPCINYIDGLPLIGWREHDRRAQYAVSRIRLLRTVIGIRSGALGRMRLIAEDLGVRSAAILRVLHLLWRERPIAVCLGELLASSWMLPLLKLVPGLRVLVYVHGEEITVGDLYDADARRRRRALAAADRVIVVSRFTRDAVARLLGDNGAGKIVLIENGVDTGRFRPAVKNADLVACYGLTDLFVFVVVCRLVERKGVDHALRAFAGVLRRAPDTRFLVVGSGPCEADLQTLAATLGIGHAVIFAGEVAEHDLSDHYTLGDVFVMPNRALANGDTEGFGLVFLEANACGLPVIAGRDGGTGDAVQGGRNGLIVDGKAIDEIEAAMTRLREDEGLRRHLREGGLRAAAQADWRIRARQFLAACEDP